MIHLYLLLAAAMAVESGSLPDPRLTPGAVLPNVTLEQICTPGYTKTVRNVPIELKKAVYREYGIRYVKGEYVVDHLVALEIGGSNDIRNLFVEPKSGEWNSEVKDQLEHKLNHMVCSGVITIHEAQEAIATNWIETYKLVFHRDQPRVSRRQYR